MSEKKQGHGPGSNLSVEPEAADLARGVCNADPKWTIKAFVSAAIFEKVKRMKINPTPSRTMRLGRPPPVPKNVPPRPR